MPKSVSHPVHWSDHWWEKSSLITELMASTLQVLLDKRSPPTSEEISISLDVVQALNYLIFRRTRIRLFIEMWVVVTCCCGEKQITEEQNCRLWNTNNQTERVFLKQILCLHFAFAPMQTMTLGVSKVQSFSQLKKDFMEELLFSKKVHFHHIFFLRLMCTVLVSSFSRYAFEPDP